MVDDPGNLDSNWVVWDVLLIVALRVVLVV